MINRFLKIILFNYFIHKFQLQAQTDKHLAKDIL